MNRGIPTALCVSVALITFLSLRAGFQAIFPVEKSSPAPKVDNSVVALADGSVMIATPGSVSRDVINWFNDEKAGPKQFDMGRQPFIPHSDRPAPEAQVRLSRFATELNANPDVNARMIVCGSGNDAADRQLASARALRLKEELIAMQDDPGQISTATCRGPSPDCAPASSEQDGQTIAIALARVD